jgi:hypothetical protein
VASLLGAIPGCLGPFVVVGMFAHGMVTRGAVVGAMIATSGDEAFVMLALIPQQAVLLGLALIPLGILAGALTDVLVGDRSGECAGLNLHDDEQCRCLNHPQILRQLKELSPARGLLVAGLGIFITCVALGLAGPDHWNWIRVTILGVSAVSLFIVTTVPDHFLEEHLWRHVAQQHVPRIFAWTFGALLLMHILTLNLHLDGIIRENSWTVLLVACLVGLVPESGPHLIFVTLYAEGAIPLSVLLASSIVQDGHGMLPLLAESRRVFLQVKLINLAVGLAVGAAAMALGL